MAAVRTFESRRDRRWLDERLAEYSLPSRHRDLDYVACKKTLSSIVTCGFLSRLWYSRIASLKEHEFANEVTLLRSLALVEKLIGTKSLEAVVQIQSEYAKAAYAAFVAHAINGLI